MFGINLEVLGNSIDPLLRIGKRSIRNGGAGGIECSRNRAASRGDSMILVEQVNEHPVERYSLPVGILDASDSLIRPLYEPRQVIGTGGHHLPFQALLVPMPCKDSAFARHCKNMCSVEAR